jgi:predicted transcriptional regulator YdeE
VGGREAAQFFVKCCAMMSVLPNAMRAVFVLMLPLSLVLALVAVEGPAVQIVHRSSFSVVGIEVRTTNAKEATGEGVIGKQWQKFFEEGTLDKIPNRADNNLYAVYSDYASDRNGEYSVLIGAKVTDGSIAPHGLELKTIPSGRYAVLPSESGPVAKVVVAAWQRVWQLEDRHALGGQRAYKADFEVYGERAADPRNSQVDLYIGLK